MSRPEIVIIAALCEKNRVIGFQNKLPWYLPEDLKRFKRLTVGHPVIMGRKTFDSIIARNGKLLPERRHIVLSRSKLYPDFPDLEVYSSMEAALAALRETERAAIIGGASLYEKGLPLADRLELTIIEKEYQGDAFFPDYKAIINKKFKLTDRHKCDGYRFETYTKIE